MPYACQLPGKLPKILKNLLLKFYSIRTFPEINSSHLKVDSWKTIVSSWGPASFQVRTVSFRGIS